MNLSGLDLYPWHRPEDIRRYPWYMTRDIATVISWVIYHGYLQISRVNSLKTQVCACSQNACRNEPIFRQKKPSPSCWIFMCKDNPCGWKIVAIVFPILINPSMFINRQPPQHNGALIHDSPSNGPLARSRQNARRRRILDLLDTHHFLHHLMQSQRHLLESLTWVTPVHIKLAIRVKQLHGKSRRRQRHIREKRNHLTAETGIRIENSRHR